jgi:DNA (cytosine-5)-methyltransferase 1
MLVYGGNDTSGPRAVAAALNAKGGSGRMDFESENMVVHALRAEGFDASEDGTGRGTPLVPIGYMPNRHYDSAGNVVDGWVPNEVCNALHTATGNGNKAPVIAYRTSGNRGVMEQGDKTAALNCNTDPTQQIITFPIDMRNATRDPEKSDEQNRQGCGCGGDSDPTYTVSVAHVNAVAFQTRIGRSGRGQPEEVCPTLQGASAGATSDMRPYIAFQERGREGGRSCESQEDVAYSIMAPQGGGRRQENNIAGQFCVRRLLPVETERLQGFPDNYTAITYRGKPAADGPRYRAIGNSMAVPVMTWLGKRIQMVEDLKCVG